MKPYFLLQFHQIVFVLDMLVLDKGLGPIQFPSMTIMKFSGTYEFLSGLLGSIRRVLSCCFVRAQALCLVSRLGQVGVLARAAAERRMAALRAEHTRREEARSNWLANVHGWRLSRVG